MRGDPHTSLERLDRLQERFEAERTTISAAAARSSTAWLQIMRLAAMEGLSRTVDEAAAQYEELSARKDAHLQQQLLDLEEAEAHSRAAAHAHQRRVHALLTVQVSLCVCWQRGLQSASRQALPLAPRSVRRLQESRIASLEAAFHAELKQNATDLMDEMTRVKEEVGGACSPSCQRMPGAGVPLVAVMARPPACVMQHARQRRECRAYMAAISEQEERRAREAAHAHVNAKDEIRSKSADMVQELSRAMDEKIMALEASFEGAHIAYLQATEAKTEALKHLVGENGKEERRIKRRAQTVERAKGVLASLRNKMAANIRDYEEK